MLTYKVTASTNSAQKLQPGLGGQTIHTVIGIHSPKELDDAANGDLVEDMLRDGTLLRYVAYVGTTDEYTRFPRSGFITRERPKPRRVHSDQPQNLPI